MSKIKKMHFFADQIEIQKFSWDESSNSQNPSTGFNFLVWSNSTPIISSVNPTKIKIFASHYGVSAKESKYSVKTAYEDCSGVALLLDLMVEMKQYFKTKQSNKEDIEEPYLFIIFDHASEQVFHLFLIYFRILKTHSSPK